MEQIQEGYDGAATLDQAPSGIHVGDVAQLIVRNIQQPGQLQPVSGRLIQHDQEFAVGQHGSGGMGLEQVVG